MLMPLRTMAHISIGMRFIATHDGSPPNLFLTALSGLLSKYSVHKTTVVVQEIATRCMASRIRDHSDGGEKSSKETIESTTIWIVNSIIHLELRSPDLASLYSSQEPRIEDQEEVFSGFSDPCDSKGLAFLISEEEESEYLPF